ncbi:MAG: hypothetical protein ACTSPS_03915 [Promethearchaeota archaeon]
MRCENCKKDVLRKDMIQLFDPDEPTTIHTFCSDKCKDKWSDSKK